MNEDSSEGKKNLAHLNRQSFKSMIKSVDEAITPKSMALSMIKS